jgi:hypothetical protein
MSSNPHYVTAHGKRILVKTLETSKEATVIPLDSLGRFKSKRPMAEEALGEACHGRKAKTKASQHQPGWLRIPAQIKLRLTPQGTALTATKRAKASVSGAALQVLCCLLDLEYRAINKDEPLVVSNVALSYWGGTRHTKMEGLDELYRRGIVTYTKEGCESPRVTLTANLLK